VSFERAPLTWDEEFVPLLAGRPLLLLALGVDSKSPGFRLERYGGPALKDVPRVDVDGRVAREFSRAGPRHESRVDLHGLLAALRARGVDEARISESAGGYVCERIYHHVLTRAEEHGIPGLFVHVPQLHFTPLARQVEVVGRVVEETLALLARAEGL